MTKQFFFFILSLFISVSLLAQERSKENSKQIDTRIDNMGYWKKKAAQGLVPVAPATKTKAATYKSSKINAKGVTTEDSPDVPVNDDGDNTQSENSIFVNPTDNSMVLNSNNSTQWTGSTVGSLYGANYFLSNDFAQTWGGSVQGAGGSNSGDPATAISLDGTQYVGFIHDTGGQGVSYSTDGGVTWTSVLAATTSGGILDKNHLWIDNSPSSPYEGNVYDAWTDFDNGSNIFFTRSTDGGLSYSSDINISSAVNSGSHDQGVNINSGPNGEVYAVWGIYDGWPTDETAIGFARSYDGGATFEPATRIIENIRGIRTTETSKNHRVNSFPVLAVDISGGDNNGTLYVVWSNVGVPGTNTGTNISVYMSKSTDQGDTWSTPVRVNQGVFDEGKEAYFPWITCDPENGILSVIFYDDRNVSSTEVETWVANSYDGGDTWEDLRISDVAFTPAPISGLAGGYMGDYLGISARGAMVYPVWPDNRNGYVQTFVSPYETNNRDKPTDLLIDLTFATGQTDLSWTYDGAKALQHFVVYRDNVEIGTTTDTSFIDFLPNYGVYGYSVTAMHEDGESSPARNSIQWGDPHINVSPAELVETLLPDQTSVQVLTIENIGELDLTYNLKTAITSKSAPKAYCTASGGGTDEYISRVQFGDIDNSSGQDNYADYTTLSTSIDAGNTYPITITNGEIWSSDDLGIWIDWNQDEDFDDPDEQVVCEVDNGADGTFDIVVPSSAMAGTTTMRIRIKYSGSDCGSPCDTTSWGEVEDYSVVVNSWLQSDNNVGTVLPGTTELVNVTFDSTDLAIGDYFADITIDSNDADVPQVIVPVTLHVVATSVLSVNATADEYNVCEGSSTILHANASGGTGTYTYAWTSDPTGFTSDEANPEVFPTENTTYTVVVDDGVNSLDSSVTIDVMPLVSTPDMPAGDDTLCQDANNTTYTTNSVAGALSYDWVLDPAAAGAITNNGTEAIINWDSAFSGLVSLSVSAVNDCGASDPSTALEIMINEIPAVSFTAIDPMCANSNVYTLTEASPAGGVYSGTGVSGDTFDPAVAGAGTHTITYTYTNAEGCENYATQDIVVNELPEVSLTAFESVFDYEPAFELTGGSPAGGFYSGPGVTDGFFDPSVAGPGIHTITYIYTDTNGCSNFAEQTIEVISTIGIEDLENQLSFNIYPNPADNYVNINIQSADAKDLQINFTNQLGMIVLSKAVQVNGAFNTQLDLSNLSGGIYLINFNGDQINQTSKVIVK